MLEVVFTQREQSDFGTNTILAAHFVLVRSTNFISNILSISDFQNLMRFGPAQYSIWGIAHGNLLSRRYLY